jgi:hypothetical protein
MWPEILQEQFFERALMLHAVATIACRQTVGECSTASTTDWSGMLDLFPRITAVSATAFKEGDDIFPAFDRKRRWKSSMVCARSCGSKIVFCVVP